MSDLDKTVTEADGEETADCYIGRQPIFDRANNVVAYEILYRSGTENLTNLDVDRGWATTEVLAVLMEHGLEKVVGNKKAFVNFSRDPLVHGAFQDIPKESLGLEISEKILTDPDIQRRVLGLRRSGYTIILDNFEGKLALPMVSQCADIVKISVRGIPMPALERQVKALKAASSCDLLALHTETAAEHAACVAMGFTYFQGFFLHHPEMIPITRLSVSCSHGLRVLATILNPELDVGAFTEVISIDVGLTYRLLRYINSASSGVRREISTVRQAILMLGLSGMRKWATYCIMDKMGDVPSEEIRVSSTLRARLCELIAQQLKLEDRDSYSLMGSLSNLEPLMRVSLVDLLKELPLAPVLNSALLGDETTMHGRVLACVKAYELGDLSRADAWPLPLKAVRELYLEALTWVNELEMD